MKSKNAIITLIVILSFLVIAIVFGIGILMNNSIDFSFGFDLGSKKMQLVETFEEDSNNIKEIEFDLYSTDVELKNNDNNNLKIEYYSNKEAANVIKKDNQKVVINEEDSKSICIGICSNHRKIIVYVPNTYTGTFNIETKSGDIKSNIEAIEGEVVIKTTSGDVNLKNVTNTIITTTSGDISLEMVNKAKLHTTSGDVFIKGESSNLDIKTTSGDIEINKINNYINLNTTSGDVLINELEITDNSFIKTTSGDVKINDNISNCYIEFDSRSGDSHINKSDRKSDLVLKVDTKSGDIRVN